MVAITAAGLRSALDEVAGAAGRLDALARGGREAVGVDDQSLGGLAAPQHLDRDVLLGLLGGLLGGRAHDSSTSTRCRTVWTMPRACGESLCSTVWPMRRRPSERSVSRWLWFAPFFDLVWVIFSVLTPRTPSARS